MKTYESYVEYVKAFILDRLEDYKGQKEYACDLAYKLCETINIDGSATYSAYEAKQYIKEWFDEAGEVIDYELNEFGENSHNPFEEPEAFMVVMIILGCDRVLGGFFCDSETWSEEWNNLITISDDLIADIINYLTQVHAIEF